MRVVHAGEEVSMKELQESTLRELVEARMGDLVLTFQILTQSEREVVLIATHPTTGAVELERYFVVWGGVDMQRMTLSADVTQALIERVGELGGLT